MIQGTFDVLISKSDQMLLRDKMNKLKDDLTEKISSKIKRLEKTADNLQNLNLRILKFSKNFTSKNNLDEKEITQKIDVKYEDFINLFVEEFTNKFFRLKTFIEEITDRKIQPLIHKNNFEIRNRTKILIKKLKNFDSKFLLLHKEKESFFTPMKYIQTKLSKKLEVKKCHNFQNIDEKMLKYFGEKIQKYTKKIQRKFSEYKNNENDLKEILKNLMEDFEYLIDFYIEIEDTEFDLINLFSDFLDYEEIKVEKIRKEINDAIMFEEIKLEEIKMNRFQNNYQFLNKNININSHFLINFEKLFEENDVIIQIGLIINGNKKLSSFDKMNAEGNKIISKFENIEKIIAGENRGSINEDIYNNYIINSDRDNVDLSRKPKIMSKRKTFVSN